MMILAVMVAAAVSVAAGPAAPPDGTYTYSIDQASKSIGTSTVTIKRAPNTILIHENQTGSLSGHTIGFIVDETLDAATLRPKSYIATYSKDGTSAVFRTTIDGSNVKISSDGMSDTATLQVPKSVRAAYIVESSIITGFLFLPAQVHAANASSFSAIIPSAVTQITDSVVIASNPVKPGVVPSKDVSLSIDGMVSYDEWYDPGNYLLHAVSVPSQDVLIHLTKQSQDTKS